MDPGIQGKRFHVRHGPALPLAISARFIQGHFPAQLNLLASVSIGFLANASSSVLLFVHFLPCFSRPAPAGT